MLGTDLPDFDEKILALQIVIAGRYRDVAEDDSFWKRVETDAVTSGADRDFANLSLKMHPNVTPEQLAKADAVLASNLAHFAHFEQHLLLFGLPMAMVALLAFGAVCGIFFSLLIGAPLGLRMNGIAVVKGNGEPAGRGRVALRAMIWGVPAAIGGLFAALAGAGTLAANGVWLLILLAGAVHAVLRRDRALHDHLTGTWLTPR